MHDGSSYKYIDGVDTPCDATQLSSSLACVDSFLTILILWPGYMNVLCYLFNISEIACLPCDVSAAAVCGLCLVMVHLGVWATNFGLHFIKIKLMHVLKRVLQVYTCRLCAAEKMRKLQHYMYMYMI